MTLADIPTDELRADRRDAVEDIATCQRAIVLGIVRCCGMWVADRIAANRAQLEVIDEELSRRASAGEPPA